MCILNMHVQGFCHVLWQMHHTLSLQESSKNFIREVLCEWIVFAQSAIHTPPFLCVHSSPHLNPFFDHLH